MRQITAQKTFLPVLSNTRQLYMQRVSVWDVVVAAIPVVGMAECSDALCYVQDFFAVDRVLQLVTWPPAA